MRVETKIFLLFILHDGRIRIRIHTNNDGSGSSRSRSIRTRIHDTAFTSVNPEEYGTRISQEGQFRSLEVAPPLISPSTVENMDKASNCHEKSRKVLRKEEREASIIAFLADVAQSQFQRQQKSVVIFIILIPSCGIECIDFNNLIMLTHQWLSNSNLRLVNKKKHFPIF
jgi:hypothetical protein